MQLKASMFCLILVLISFSAVAQHFLLLKTEREEDQKVLATFSWKTRLPDSAAAGQQVHLLLKNLQENGYLLANVKELNTSHDTTKALFLIGSQFRLARLSADSIDKNWLNRTSWRQKSYLDKPFRYRQVSRLMQQLLEQAENSGYPFAAVKLDSVKIENSLLEARLQMEQGPYIIFDTIVVKGNAKVLPKFLAAHLGIRYGEPYSQEKVREVEGLIRSLPYLRMLGEPKVSFQNRQGTLYLDLGQKKSNVIDGVVGILPDPGEKGRMMFTGQFDLLLHNPFGTGKRIEMHWQRLNQLSQNLEAAYYHPYLFNSVLSLEAGFSLLKEEENFVNRQLKGELQMRQGANNTIRILAQQKDSRLLGAARSADFASFSLAQFGFGFSRQRLNDPLVPQRGYQLSMDVTGGRKNIRSLALNTDSLQQGLPGPGMQYRASGSFRYYRPLGQQLVWAHTLEAGLLADDRLFLNDMYRLGGLSSLRGFQEKSFFASDYVLSRMELRYLAGSDTYLFMFYDQSRMVQKQGNLHVTDWPLGCGAGLSLGTSSGTFNFVYGLGRSQMQPMSFTQSQVHFGYVNRF